MRRALIGLVFLPLTACWSSGSNYYESDGLMGEEIRGRVNQIAFQHRDELYQNLLWLAQSGEPALPALVDSLSSKNPKVRSSCAWVLGQIGDRRTITDLQDYVDDEHPTVRMEVARSLLVMGDMEQAPALIEGLDANRTEVRYMCHEALKSASGRDFGFDHLSQDLYTRRQAVLQWRKWWSDVSGDEFFSSTYAAENGLDQDPTGAPMGGIRR